MVKKALMASTQSNCVPYRLPDLTIEVTLPVPMVKPRQKSPGPTRAIQRKIRLKKAAIRYRKRFQGQTLE